MFFKFQKMFLLAFFFPYLVTSKTENLQGSVIQLQTKNILKGSFKNNGIIVFYFFQSLPELKRSWLKWSMSSAEFAMG